MFNVDLKPHNHISGFPNSIKGEIPGLFSFCPNFFSVLFFLPTGGEGNVFTRVCQSVHNRPHGYWFTTHPCYGAVSMHPTGMLSCLS